MSVGRWCPESWWGPDAIEGKAGRYPWQPSEREPPVNSHIQGAWRWRDREQDDMGPPTPKPHQAP